MAFAVSLVMEFKSPVGVMDFYDKVKAVSQGLGLPTPARAEVEHVGPNTISISKMICAAPVFNKLTKLLRPEPEDAIIRELLERHEINGLFMLSKEPSVRKKPISLSNIANPPEAPLASVEPRNSSPIESQLKVKSNDAGAGTTTSSSSISQMEEKEPRVPVHKRPILDETGHNDHPSKRLKTTCNPEKEVDNLESSLLEETAEFEVAKEIERETMQSLPEKPSEIGTALANSDQEPNSVTQKQSMLSEVQAKLLTKEKELRSAAQAVKDVKARNKLLLRENNEKNDALLILKDNKRTADETIEALRQQLDSERALRLKAEKLIDDIRHELKFPFIVPSLLDAFIVLSESKIQIVPATLPTDSG